MRRRGAQFAPMVVFLLSLMALIAPSGAAAAEDEAMVETVDACRNSADEMALYNCREADLAAVKAVLEEQVKILFDRYNEDGPDHAAVLTDAQETWTRFIEAECRHLTYESSTGSAAAVYEFECLSTLCRRRIADLQDLVDSP